MVEVEDMLLFWVRVMLVWRMSVGASLGLVKFERAFIQRIQLLAPGGLYEFFFCSCRDMCILVQM